MTVDDLKEHLDRRLDAQDTERKEVLKEVGDLKLAVGLGQQAQVNAAQACATGHEEHGKRISRMEGGFIAAGSAALIACVKFLHDAATGKAGG